MPCRRSAAAVTVLAATDRGQRSLPDVTYDIGLFTRYAIEGLAGAADLPPVGNGNGTLDTAEIYAFTAAFVDLAARRRPTVCSSVRSIPAPPPMC